jgi:hypothetical protein
MGVVGRAVAVGFVVATAIVFVVVGWTWSVHAAPKAALGDNVRIALVMAVVWGGFPGMLLGLGIGVARETLRARSAR